MFSVHHSLESAAFVYKKGVKGVPDHALSYLCINLKVKLSHSWDDSL